jgi:hypothetical protein
MSDHSTQTGRLEQPSREEMQAALFADLVTRQANLASMFLGLIPQPQSGERTLDLEAARMFIDQLEMLEEKTRGHRSAFEDHLLKQTMTQLQMGFVQASERAAAPAQTAAPPASSPASSPAPGTTPSPAPDSAPSAPTAGEQEQKVKFTKKY